MDEEEKLPSHPEGDYSTGDPEGESNTARDSSNNGNVSPELFVSEERLKEKVGNLLVEIEDISRELGELKARFEVAKTKYLALKQESLERNENKGDVVEAFKILAGLLKQIGYKQRILNQVIDTFTGMYDQIEEERSK